MKVKIGKSKIKRKINKRIVDYLNETINALENNEDESNRDFIINITRFYVAYGNISEKQLYWVDTFRRQLNLAIITDIEDTAKREDLRLIKNDVTL